MKKFILTLIGQFGWQLYAIVIQMYLMLTIVVRITQI